MAFDISFKNKKRAPKSNEGVIINLTELPAKKENTTIGATKLTYGYVDEDCTECGGTGVVAGTFCYCCWGHGS